MPFYNNIYYPLSSEPQGAHSSAGIPSLLSSPQSQPSSGGQGQPDSSTMSGAFGGTALPAPFKFRARHESVDWRRINAVDVDRVACELDFQMLQEHVATVAFCNLEGERCTRCHSQVDPALLKLFRLSQLIVEYLLHSQDCLAISLQVAEQRLQAQAHEVEQLTEQLRKCSQDAKSLKEELKQRRKIITSQQAMISAGLANYHKCQHCEKAFMNASFLQSHMQRRHPMDYDMKLMTDNQKKVQTVKLAEEVNRLQDQLMQMEAQQKDYTAERNREKDLTQKQEQFMKQLEVWKEDERVRMNHRIDEVKQACQREMDSLHQRNRNLEKEVLKLQQSNKIRESTQAAQTQANLAQNSDDKHWQEVAQLRQKFHRQEMKWAAKMQKMKEEHENEKGQLQASLSQMRSSVSEGKEEAWRHTKELELRLQEQEQIIAYQSKQMKQITSSPPTLVVQREVSTPELKNKVVVNDSSSVTEAPFGIQSWQQKADELLQQPGLKRDMRLVVQQSLQYKLLNLGIQPGVSGLSKTAYKSAMTKVASERQQRQTKNPAYHQVQKEINQRLEQRAQERTMVLASKSKQPAQALSLAQPRPRSSSLPNTVTRVASGHPPKLQHTPQPAHWSKTGTQTPKPTISLLHQKTPPFSSDENSSEEDESEEKSPQTQKPSQVKAPQVNTTAVKTQHPRAQQRTAPQALAPRSDALHQRVQQAPVLSVSRTEGTEVESESEWTEGSEMEELALERLSKLTDQNGNVQKTFHNNVKALTKNLEQQLEERGLRKPVGGVNTVSEKPSTVTKTNDVVQELKYTDINGSDDDDWDISSLEDIPAALKPNPALVRKSADKSIDTSTSVWGTSTGKGQKPGLNAGTGSSIVTVSDWDDSDGI
ncbi:zinc finger protein Dzip1 isoform X2 [Electrophorus electricus]|uniref:zinc finger protein Dzip1 isoform X1 n=1 Tax=Electrophorus electricus TaxID=8005 RepID=UPI0015D07865|nr:zinc finger protein Dzip1 isoform X1 [Electrophorus electricus]XP_026870299.2 zinc finger protein Dzip1 isoform X1 [Electrophorus electricus]XP_026870308.2 zinc finger protein Dzip1 isoform X1 [Electrophorus electricus]XP_026870318.2 zinc finger protein Dzip1 isoform X1 [Electrophorus electricus]XP_035388223.1 zinc finger protein Dzip1 isoform X2 [Electrophorus electricus]